MNRLSSIYRSINRNGLGVTLSILYQFLLIKLGLKNTVNFSGYNYYLRKGTSDMPVFRQIFMDGEYDFHISSDPHLILDLGANIGLSAAYFATRYSSARIIALEPSKSNYQQLLLNTAKHPNVKPYNLAIWSETKNLEIDESQMGGEWATQVKAPGTSGSTQVIKGISIPELAELESFSTIDLLKVDIEGAEEELFKDPYWFRKVRLTAIELHDAYFPSSSNNFFRALNSLGKFSFYTNGENIIIKNEMVD